MSFTSAMRARRLQQLFYFRHGVLRICEHTELWNVETFKLHLFVDAQGADGVHSSENQIGEAERIDCAERGATELHPELGCVPVEQARHPQACLAKVRRCANAVPAGAVSAIREDTDGNS